jgi:tubulin beta
MPREIVHIQVGQCGNQIGTAFWNTMRKEHHIKEDGVFEGDKTKIEDKQRLDKVDVYFKETGSLRFVPRAVLVDLEPGTLDVIKSSQLENYLNKIILSLELQVQETTGVKDIIVKELN